MVALVSCCQSQLRHKHTNLVVCPGAAVCQFYAKPHPSESVPLHEDDDEPVPFRSGAVLFVATIYHHGTMALGSSRATECISRIVRLWSLLRHLCLRPLQVGVKPVVPSCLSNWSITKRIFMMVNLECESVAICWRRCLCWANPRTIPSHRLMQRTLSYHCLRSASQFFLRAWWSEPSWTREEIQSAHSLPSWVLAKTVKTVCDPLQLAGGQVQW